MTTAIAPIHGETGVSAQVLETTLLQGDLSRLDSKGRVEYMTAVCRSLGLNPLTKPFEFLSLNGKLVMYAKRDCTEQLRKIHRVSIVISAREVVEDCYVVTARATDGNGRQDESIGAVPIAGLKGEARSNAMMKAETKAKRRVTLSVCGLGLLDETEVSSIPGAEPAPAPTPGPRRGNASREERAAYRQEMGEPTIIDDPATHAQVTLIHTLRGKCNYTDDRHRDKLWGTYKVDTSKNLTSEQASDYIDYLQAEVEKRTAEASSRMAEMAGDLEAMGAVDDAGTQDVLATPAENGDSGVAASDEAKAQIRAEVKRLGWKPQFARLWLAQRTGLQSVDALTEQQAADVYLLLSSHGKPIYDAVLAEMVAEKRVQP